MQVTNKEIYIEVMKLQQRMNRIENSLNGNGAIGVIQQIKDNKTDVMKVKKEIYLFKKVYYTIMGAFMAITTLLGWYIKKS